jgi:hypothetical protein
MARLPKLKIKSPFGDTDEDICDLAEAKHRLNFSAEVSVVVERRLVNSYEELVQLASQEDYRNNEYLAVELLPALIGGG